MGTRVYVGRLPYRANERDVENFFRGYGRIMEVIMKNGYCFVEFADYRDADDAAHDLNGRDMLGDRIHVELARGTPRGRDRYGWRPPVGSSRDNRSYTGRSGGMGSRRKDKADRTEWRIVVENLSSRVSWQDLKDFMRQAGEVTYTDAHGKKRNEGLVEFATKADMKTALAKLDGKDLNGKKIKLMEEKKAKQKSRSRSRSGSKEKKRSESRSHSRSQSKEKDKSGSSKERKDKGKEKVEEREKEKKSESNLWTAPKERRKKEKGKEKVKEKRRSSRSSKSKSKSKSRSPSKSPVGKESPKEDGKGKA